MRRAVAQFRAVAAKYPTDPRFIELIADLQTNSAEFRRLWAEHDVLGSTDGLKRFDHPEFGELILDTTTFELPGDGDIGMVVLTAAAGSETEQKSSGSPATGRFADRYRTLRPKSIPPVE